MKKIFCLLSILIFVNISFAQHKILTIYYPDSTRIINMTNADSMQFFICGSSKINYEGRYYNTVLIGNQCWLKENLNVGTKINVTQSMSNNGVIEKYCYNNDTTYCDTYGGLYTWNEIMKYGVGEGSQGICPEGWHIPTRSDFLTLIAYVDSNANALKREDQGTGQGLGTNTSGFSALLTGAKKYDNSTFIYLNEYGMLYSSYTEPCYGEYCSATFELNATQTRILTVGSGFTRWGLGVRCIRDVN